MCWTAIGLISLFYIGLGYFVYLVNNTKPRLKDDSVMIDSSIILSVKSDDIFIKFGITSKTNGLNKDWYTYRLPYRTAKKLSMELDKLL